MIFTLVTCSSKPSQRCMPRYWSSSVKSKWWRKVRNLTCLFRCVSAPHRCPLSQHFSGVLSIFLHFPLHWKSQLYLLRLFPTFHKKVDKVRSHKKILWAIILIRFYARLIRRKQGTSTAHEDFLLHETMHRNGVHHGRIYLKVGTISQYFTYEFYIWRESHN